MRSLLRVLWSRLRSLVRKDRLDRDFDDELTTHLELLTDEARRRGLSEADARREALLKLGRPESLREQHRDARGLPLVDALVQDSKYVIRMLWKSPVFTGVVTLTLALGIGANTALFSLVDNLLLRSLPVRDPDRLVQLQVFSSYTPPDAFRKPMASSFDRTVFEAVRAKTQVFADVVGFMRLEDRPEITVDGAVEPVREVEQVSENYFTGLGVSPIVGRSPLASDGNVAVISARWWHVRFGGREDVIGRALTIAGKRYAIIGVAPLRFHGFEVDRSADIWIFPAAIDLDMVARLQPGVTPVQAQAAVHPILDQDVLKRYPREASEPRETEALAAGQGLSRLRYQYKTALLALMALVAVVLLTTCTNVGNLLMLRNAARRRELIVRAALGADRPRLIVQSLVESTFVAAAGCIAGLFLARWGVSIILSMLPLPEPPGGLTFDADARVVGFAIGVSVLSVLLSGLEPAWRATDVDLTGALRSSQGVTQPKRTRRLGRVLVACQVGLSVLLLVGAGLFVQTLRNLSRLDMGFSADQLLQVRIEARNAGYKEEEQERTAALYRLLLERVRAIPGVRSTASVGNPLMHGSSTSMAIPLPGLEHPGNEMWDAVGVGPQFFETMGIELVRGRTFTASDFLGDYVPAPVSGPGVRPLAEFLRRNGPFVINEAFARRYYPNADPLVSTSPVVGIVRDAKLLGVGNEIGPLMFLASRRPHPAGALVVRTARDTKSMAPAIREAIQAVNPRLLLGIDTVGEVMNRNIAKERMVAAISGFFGLLGLSLACMGIFGVASNAVAQRTRELGIRRALGAGRWAVIRESLRETLVVVAVGLAGGAVAAFVIVRLTASVIADLLFGLTATDAANLLAAVGVMAAVAIVACVWPAHRATRIDPLAIIRDE
jgi:predicted permease